MSENLYSNSILESLTTDSYKTRDLYFASFLLATGGDLLDLIFDESGGFFWFQFNNKALCEQKDREFQLNKLVVNAKDMAESIKYLKKRVSQ